MDRKYLFWLSFAINLWALISCGSDGGGASGASLSGLWQNECVEDNEAGLISRYTESWEFEAADFSRSMLFFTSADQDCELGAVSEAVYTGGYTLNDDGITAKPIDFSIETSVATMSDETRVALLNSDGVCSGGWSTDVKRSLSASSCRANPNGFTYVGATNYDRIEVDDQYLTLGTEIGEYAFIEEDRPSRTLATRVLYKN